MNGKLGIKASLLTLAITLPLAGCGNHNKKMTQDEVQYLSHMDQAHFFQKQGELRASTKEARSAHELEPHNAQPYLLVIDNLLISGDVTNAENELSAISKHLDKNIPAEAKNQITLDWARVELMKKKYDAALKHLDAFEKPKKNEALEQARFDNMRGKILLAKGDVGAAGKAYQQALTTDSKSVDAMVGLSRVAYQQGNKDEAQKQLSAALKQDKENSDAWLWKAQMAQMEKDYPTAESAYMKALDGIGKYDVMTYQKYETISALIQVLRAENKIQQAYVYEEMLAKSGPGMILSEFQSAVKAYKTGNLDAAATHLQNILKRAPNNRQAAMLLGLVLFQQGKTEEAQKVLKPIEKNGQSLGATKLLAATQISMGQSQQARKMLEQLKGGDQDPGVLGLVGAAAISAGEIDVGKQYIEKSLKLQPNNINLRLRYTNWLMSRSNFKQAASQAQQAIATDPKSVAARRLLISAYLHDKAPDKAYQSVEKWRKEQPDSAAAVLASGDLEASQKHYDKALGDYRKAEKMAPKSPEVQIALGKLMTAQNRQSQAISHYEKAVQLAPNDRQALVGLMMAANRSPAQRKQAFAFLQKQAQKDSKAAGPRVLLLEHALEQGDFKQSESLADELNKLSKNHEGTQSFMASVYTNAALLAMNQKNDDRAQKIISLAMKRFPTSQQIGLVNARYLLSQGKENDALDVLRKLKQDHPSSPRPYLLEASYREQKKQYDQAVELYKLAKEKSSDPTVDISLAEAQTLAGNSDKALQTLESAAKTYPDAPAVLLQLAMSYQSAKKDDEAIKAYEHLLEISPDQPVALNNLAWLYQQKGDKRAAQTAKRAYDLRPDSAAIADTYGWILLQNGDAKASVPILEAAHKQAPNQKEIALHLAQAYKQTSQNQKAKAILEKF